MLTYNKGQMAMNDSDGKNLIKVSKRVLHTYNIYLTDEVTSVEDYQEIADVLHNATELDTINLHLANFGGSCHACIYLVNFVRACKATVVCIVSGPCYSAGATLAIAGHGIEIRPNTFLMFHNYSSTTHGKGGELQMSVEHTNRWIHRYFKDIHYPFLSRKEIKQIENDRDLYVHFDDKDLLDRCERHYKYRNK